MKQNESTTFMVFMWEVVRRRCSFKEEKKGKKPHPSNDAPDFFFFPNCYITWGKV